MTNYKDLFLQYAPMSVIKTVENLHTVPDVARFCNVFQCQVYSAFYRGVIPQPYRVRGKTFFTDADLPVIKAYFDTYCIRRKKRK